MAAPSKDGPSGLSMSASFCSLSHFVQPIGSRCQVGVMALSCSWLRSYVVYHLLWVSSEWGSTGMIPDQCWLFTFLGVP
jgi:hypothetical protein